MGWIVATCSKCGTQCDPTTHAFRCTCWMNIGGWRTLAQAKPKRELTESDKALHRAISQSSNDGKRYGVGQYVRSE